jgi:hypothetical protein
LTRSCIEEHDRIHPLERSALPGGHLGDDAIRHRADQIRRDFHGVHFREEALDFPHGHPARVQRQNLVVEAGEAALVFGDQPRLEGALTIPRHVNPQRTVIGQHRLATRSVAMIRRVVRFVAAGRVTQMVRQLPARSMMAFLIDGRPRRAPRARSGLGAQIDQESRTGPGRVERQG